MKEKIIQVVVSQASFWGSLGSCLICLTDRGNVYIQKVGEGNRRLHKVDDLPPELQPLN